MLNSSCYKVAHSGFHFLLFKEPIWGKYWEEDTGLLDLAVQSSTSNCLVLKHAQTILELFAQS